MGERKSAVVGLLIVSTFIGCSSERNLEKAPQAGTPRQSRPARSIDSTATTPADHPPDRVMHNLHAAARADAV